MPTESDSRPFWERLSLQDMTDQQWESLCDGCGKCCLHKLQDEDTEELYFTRVICRYYDENAARCSVYATRSQKVPTCITLDADNVDTALSWMPNTCAYRLLAEGRPLPLWHPLIAGGRDAMVKAGQSVSGRVVSEEHVHPEGYEEHLIDWVSADALEEEG